MIDLQAPFEKVAADVMELPKRPDDQTLLKLFGLYKQDIDGNIKGKRPGFSDVKRRVKYEAWGRFRCKSPEWAMGEYVKLVGELQGK